MRSTRHWQRLAIVAAGVVLATVLGPAAAAAQPPPSSSGGASMPETLYVVIDRREPAYTLYTAIRADQVAGLAPELRASEAVQLVGLQDFTRDAADIVKAGVTSEEYGLDGTLPTLLQVLRETPGTPIGITWNGGIAVTYTDYQHARRMHQRFLDDPAAYRRQRAQQP
jgi:hypothetical protein